MTSFWTGQFGIADGQALEQTPWVGVYPDPGRAEEPSDLYVLVHPALPGSEEFCGEMKEAIGEIFHREKASLTGGMLRALRSAHENLRDWNRRSLKHHRVAAGVSCLAIGDGQAYLAQVGPSAALYLCGSELQMITPRLPEATEALGLFDEFWPEFTSLDLDTGDRLLLLSPTIPGAVPLPEMKTVLSMPVEDALPELYRKTRGLDNCAALQLAAVPEAAAAG